MVTRTFFGSFDSHGRPNSSESSGINCLDVYIGFRVIKVR